MPVTACSRIPGYADAILTHAALRVCIELCRLHDEGGSGTSAVTVSMDNLATRTGLSLRSVGRAIVELDQAGVVSHKRGVGYGNSNTYWLRPPTYRVK